MKPLRQRRAVNPQKRPAPYWPWNQPCVFIGLSGTAQATSRDPWGVFSVQKSHTGSAEGDFSEVCTEIHKEGPRSEADIAKQPERPGGAFLLTPFSRQCAQLWLARFGRRFACQRKRKDAGVLRLERGNGALVGVKRRHVVATGRLLQMAAQDQREPTNRLTILGCPLRSLHTDNRPAFTASKALTDFRTTTEKRIQDKNAAAFGTDSALCRRSFGGPAASWFRPRPPPRNLHARER